MSEPTPEDLGPHERAWSLQSDLERCAHVAEAVRRVREVQAEQGKEPYTPQALVDLGYRALTGWPVAIRRALAAEAEVERLRRGGDGGQPSPNTSDDIGRN